VPFFLFIFLLIAGCALMIVALVMLLVKAFKVNSYWGMAMIFIPFLAIPFIAMHFNNTKTEAVLLLLGLLCISILFVF